MGQDTVLQVSVDLLDPGKFAVDLVRGLGIEHGGFDGGEEGMEAVRVKERGLACGGFGVQLRDASHDQAPGNPFACLAESDP